MNDPKLTITTTWAKKRSFRHSSSESLHSLFPKDSPDGDF